DKTTGQTPLISAVLTGNVMLAEKFLAKKADPNFKHDKKNVLQYALGYNRWFNSVTLLLNWGANPANLSHSFNSEEDRELFKMLVKAHKDGYSALSRETSKHIPVPGVA